MAASVVNPDVIQHCTILDGGAEAVAQLFQRNSVFVHSLNLVSLVVGLLVLLVPLIFRWFV